MSFGKLTLIAAPIEEFSQLSVEAKELLLGLKLEEDIVLIEDAKPARRRWIHWGLDRSWIEHFMPFNEHNHRDQLPEIIKLLKSGKNIYLMSDCGLPAFCDPGQDLVNACHENRIEVTATPFGNSVILALALSGFESEKFLFEGFISLDQIQRLNDLKSILKSKYTTIVMDTAYRLKKLLLEFKELEGQMGVKKLYFLAMDLNKPTQVLVRGNINQLIEKAQEKQEFILIIKA